MSTNGMFYTPDALSYGGSKMAQEASVAQSAQRMDEARRTGDAALSNVAYAGGNAGQRAEGILGQAALNQAAPIYAQGGAQATQAAQAYDPRAAIAAQQQMAQEQALRNSLALARSGPNAALATRQALQQQGIMGLQSEQQAYAAALQGEQARAQLGIQAAQVNNQMAGMNAQAQNAELQRLQSLGLAQSQMGIQGAQYAAGLGAQMGQFREGLYSDRDINAQQQQLQAQMFNQQMEAQAMQAKQAFTGGIISASAGVIGGAAGAFGGGA